DGSGGHAEESERTGGRCREHGRGQAALDPRGPLEARDDDRDATHHVASFSSTNEPITSASSGDVKKHSTASRGVQTLGSPRVLNDVFTSTGTPVRRSNAQSRS